MIKIVDDFLPYTPDELKRKREAFKILDKIEIIFLRYEESVQNIYKERPFQSSIQSKAIRSILKKHNGNNSTTKKVTFAE